MTEGRSRTPTPTAGAEGPRSESGKTAGAEGPMSESGKMAGAEGPRLESGKTARLGRVEGRRNFVGQDLDDSASARRRILDSMPRPDERPQTPPPPSTQTPSLPPATSPTAPPATPFPTRTTIPPGRMTMPGSSSRISSPRISMSPTSRFGTSPAPDARPDRSLGLALSPRMTAIFGGLFGLATITTIIALLIQSVPPRNDRDASASASASAAAAAAASTSAEAAPPERPSKKRIRLPLPGPPRVAAMDKSAGARVVSGSFERKSFLAALTDKGVPTGEVYRVIKAFEALRKFDKTAKTDKFVVALDKASNRIIGFEYILSPYEILQATEQNGLLVAAKLDMQLIDAEVVGSVYVEKNLARALEEGGFEPSLAKEIDEALNGRMSTESFQEGGTLRIIATETTALGDFARYKEIVAFEYRPPDPAQEPTRAYAFQGKRVRGYFDEKARQPDGSGWTIPVPGAPITSRYNPKRLHPVLKKIMPHNGTDFGAATGTPIYAAYRGKISQFGPAGPCGNMVTLDHAGGIQTGYCHMSRFADGLKAGMSVGTKQLIGYVGTTGRSTGPHLHFWAKRDGKFIDAESLKMNGFRVIPSDERDEFLARKAALDARLEAIPLPDPPPRRVAPDPSTAASARGPDAAGSAAVVPGDGPAPKDGAAPSDPALADPGGPDPAMPPAASGAVPFDDEGEDLHGPDLSAAGLKKAASAKPPPH